MVTLGLFLLIMVNAVTPIKVGSNRLFVLILITTLLILPFTYQQSTGQLELFNGYLALSPLTTGLTQLTVVLTFIFGLALTNVQVNGPMTLLCTIGALFLIESNHLITLILAIELQSFTAYLLVASSTQTNYNVKAIANGTVSAAMRYLILGATASSLILLATTLLYFTTGLLDYNGLLLLGYDPKAMVPFVMLVIGSAFKLGLAPLHQWTPEVYGQINNYTMGFISIVPKLGVLMLFNHLLSHVVPQTLICTLAALSMIVGSIGGLTQIQFRRLMAFSSISHMGYLTLAASYCPDYIFLFYIVQYAFTTLATLFCFNAIDTQNTGLVSAIQGKLTTNTPASLTMIFLVLSLAGIPPFVGFFAKLEIFNSLLNNAISLTYFVSLIALITSAIGAFYYLRLIYFSVQPNQAVTTQNSAFKQSTTQILAPIVMLALTICLDSNLLLHFTTLFTLF